MRLRLLTITFGILLIPGLAWGQEGTITGTVTDENNGDPLPGANVIVQEEQGGAATDTEGRYTLEIAPGTYTLLASFVGYQERTVEVTVEAGETVRHDFALQPDHTGLEEVVVTGLAQQQTQAEASISVTNIDAAGLADAADFQSVTGLLQGSTPGLTVSKTSGNVGSSIRFNVRSGVSLNSDSQPAVYLDGTRINNDQFQGAYRGGQATSALSSLNPDNIESIEVLKGPAAAALYGTDGADGVILIETKSGSDGHNLRVNYKGTLGYSEKVKGYDPGSYTNAEFANQQFRQGDTDEHQVSVRGTANNLNYYASYTNRRTKGITPNNSGARNNFQANFEVNPGEEWRFSGKSSVTTNEYFRPGNDNLLAGLLTSTLLGSPDGPKSIFGPLEDLLAIDDKFRVARYTGNASATFTPETITGLRVQGSVGGDITSLREDVTWPRGISFPGGAQGQRQIINRNNRQFNANLDATYNYEILPDLSATSTVGGQAFTESRQQSNMQSQDFGSAAITAIGTGNTLPFMSENVFNRRSGGIFARQTFSYDDTYNLNLSLRRDYSTRITPGDNSAFTAWYPGIRGNVRLSQFDFVPESITLFKVRAAFGQTGALPGVLDTQELRITGTQSGFGTGGTIGSVGNPDLQAETVSEYTVGIDLGFQNRYSLSATYYNQSTSNSIVRFQPAPSTGLGGFNQPRNVGEIMGQGIETSLDLTLFQTTQHRVQFRSSYTYRQADVNELSGQTIPGVFDRNFMVEGLPPKAFYGLKVDGAQFADDGQYAGVNVVDQNDDGVINSDDRVQLGNPKADHFGGAQLNVQLFKNFSVTARAEYRVGQQALNGSKRFATDFGRNPKRRHLQGQIFPSVDPVEGTSQLEPGTEEYRNAANEYAETSPLDQHFDNYLEDSDWLKLREISVSYDFGGLIGRFVEGPLPVRTFRLTVAGRNLFTFTEYSGPDPEINFTGVNVPGQNTVANQISSNQDFYTLQQPRTFTATLNVGF